MIMICFFCIAQEAQESGLAEKSQTTSSGGVGSTGDPIFDDLFTSEEMKQLDTTHHLIPSELLDARKNASRKLINQGFWKGMFNFLRGNCAKRVEKPDTGIVVEKDNGSQEEK